MPSFNYLEEQDIKNIYAYLVTLSKHAPQDGALEQGESAQEGDSMTGVDAELLQKGKKVYSAVCFACHQAEDKGGAIGHTFNGLYGAEADVAGEDSGYKDFEKIVVDENYLLESINMPNAKKRRGYENAVMAIAPLQPEQIDAVIYYIKSLKDN